MNQIAEPGWKNAFTVMQTNYSLPDDAIGVFAINLRFNLDDIQTIASEAITGGGDDKKCDVHFGRGQAILERRESSNGKPSSKDAACINRQSQPELSNQMSQIFS